MASTPETLATATEYYQLGKIIQAAQLYQEILQTEPNQLAALQGLGAIALLTNSYDLAIDCFSKAIQQNPFSSDLHHNLGNALREFGQPESAITHYHQALALTPNLAEVYKDLGISLQQQGNLAAAIASYQESITLQPYQPQAWHNLGLAQQQQGNLELAITSYQQAIAFQSDCAQFHLNLAQALQQQQRLDEAIAHYEIAIILEPCQVEAYQWLGIALQQQQRIDEAIANYQQLLLIQPYSARTHINLGLALRTQRRTEEAITHYQQALTLEPDTLETYIHLGNAWRDLGEWEASSSYFQQALTLNPNYVDAHNGLGVTLSESGQLSAATTHYQKALALDPSYLNAHYNLSLAWLKLGNFPLGFAEYEWRWQKADTPPRLFPQPLWDGSSLKGKTILLHGEQGFGDQIQFIRYVPLVAQAQAHIIVECSPALVHLFSTLTGIAQLVATSETLPPFDVHAPLMSLPLILGTTLETIPAKIPYLYAKTAKAELEIPVSSRLKVGITWAGNPAYQGDYNRSCSLSHFLPLLQIPNFAFYSLQKGYRAEELTQMSLSTPIQDLGSWLNDFADTASVLSKLDLIITTDTALPHLAGALGKPTWLILPFSPDWRWLLNRNDSPWYPTLRLFRQSQPGDWAGVMKQVKQALIDNFLRLKTS